MQQPSPEQYQPRLGVWSQAYRILGMAAISAFLWWATAPLQWRGHRVLFWVDLLVGLACLGLSFLRRRWPLPIAVLTTAAGCVSVSASGPGILAAVSLATRRRLWQIVLVGVVGLASSVVFAAIEPEQNHDPWWVTIAVGIAFTVAMLACGMYIGSRRELLWTLRDRAHRAEAEQGLQAQRARVNERARIAREMHDVLAHRISLVSMHAGALAYRTNLSEAEIRQTAELIQTKAHEALTDLRRVLGVLRGDEHATPEPPQPTFDDLTQLVRESTESGMRIEYDDGVDDTSPVPEQVGRTAYRIVQEGLTNARKHAPGEVVRVSVAGSAAAGVDIRIENPAASLAPATTPGAGLGLVGLAERAKLSGGRLDSGRVNGSFRLHGWLPWET